MCFSQPKPPEDNSAEIIRAQEAARQGQINAGKAKIDDSFASFNDDYYNNIGKTYQDYYNPQIDSQFKEAKDKLTYSLARQGNLDSQTAATQYGNFQSEYDKQRANIANQGISAANDARARVSAQKTNLYNLNNASADPNLAQQQAQSATDSLRAPAAYSPLGSVFSSLVGSLANNYAVGQQTSAAGRFGSNTGVQTNSLGRDSSTIVGG